MDMKSNSLIVHVEESTLARLKEYRTEVYEQTGKWRSFDYLIAKLLVRR